MANTNLYNVLSGLNITDSKLWNKIKGLSGQVSDAFGADAFVVVGKDGGITASTLKLGTDADTTLSASSTLATEAAVKAYVDAQEEAQGTALTGVTNGAAISSSINNKNATIGVVTDDVTIGVDNNGLKSLLTLKKLDTAETGYAASYQLQNGAGTAVGDTINIFKDQFLSGAHYDSTTEELVLDFIVADPAGTDTAAQVKINAHDLVHELSGSNAITVTDVKGGQSEISLKLDTAAAGAESGDGKFLSITSNGLLLSGVQDAIDAASSDATAGLTALSAALTDYLGENAVSAQFAADDARLDTIEAALTDYLSGSAVKNQFAADDARLDKLEAQFATVDSALTASKIVETDASGKIITNGHAVAASTTTWDETSDALVPTMKAVTDFVELNLDTILGNINTLNTEIGD